VAKTRVTNCLLHGLNHRWQWQESRGERDALSHGEFLFTWRCLGKKRKPLVMVINFFLASLFKWVIKLQGSRMEPRCLLTKILILTKVTQVLLHPDLATVSSGR
jgi:hypothetical protein